MGVSNIPNNLVFDTLINKDTSPQTYQYSAERFNCQDYTSKRLEAVGLLTEPLRNFIMQDVPALLPDAKIQLQLAKGVTNIASIFENIMQGGEMCNCGSKCGCSKQLGGYVDSHVHFKDGQYPDVTGNNTGFYMSKYYNTADDIRRQAGMGKKKQKGGLIETHIHRMPNGQYTRINEPHQPVRFLD